MRKFHVRLMLILVMVGVAAFGITAARSANSQGKIAVRIPYMVSVNIMGDYGDTYVISKGDWVELFARLDKREFDIEMKLDGESLEQIAVILPAEHFLEIISKGREISPNDQVGSVHTAPHILYRAKVNGKTTIKTVVSRDSNWKEVREIHFVVSEVERGAK